MPFKFRRCSGCLRLFMKLADNSWQVPSNRFSVNVLEHLPRSDPIRIHNGDSVLSDSGSHSSPFPSPQLLKIQVAPKSSRVDYRDSFSCVPSSRIDSP